jgi:hypothetical protein
LRRTLPLTNSFTGRRLQGVCAIYAPSNSPTSLQDDPRAFNFGEFIDNKAQQPIPPTIAADEANLSAFRDLCYDLSLHLNPLLGIGLEVLSPPPSHFPQLTRPQVNPPTFFTTAHHRTRGPSGTILRFLRYPPRSTDQPPTTDTTDNNTDIRAGAHSDYGSLTLLFRLRGQPGLEILLRDGKTWSPVPVVPPGTESDPAPPILMNIGDLLAYWTGGLLRSTVHRVVFPSSSGDGDGEEKKGAVVEGEVDSGTRYSIAYFCHPFGGAELGVVPSERVRGYEGGLAEGNPYAERRVLTADEHLRMRYVAAFFFFWVSLAGWVVVSCVVLTVCRLKASYAQLYEEKK